MKRKFKSKKHIRIKIIPIIIILFLITIFIITLNYINKNTSTKSITQLLNESNNYNNNYKTVKNELIKLITGININNPTTMLESTTNYEVKETIAFNFTHNEIEHNTETQEPLVYIYNTHQTEEYVGDALTPTPTVLTGAYYLKDLLEGMGIKTIVEETSIKEILNNNNWNYTQSYRASRINLEKIKQQYPSIKIFIDFHRDAVSRNISTVEIDGKSCAKVLFVIGKEHDNYLSNLEFTNKLNNIIENKYPTLTKGILQKEGIGVNGIYNQDVATNVILMEVGGNENNFEEVTNTLELIAPIIKEDING